MIPANLGVNPSLTITALSERAMSFIPLASELNRPKFFEYEKNWKVTNTLFAEESPRSTKKEITSKKKLPEKKTAAKLKAKKK